MYMNMQPIKFFAYLFFCLLYMIYYSNSINYTVSENIKNIVKEQFFLVFVTIQYILN
jgi:hypothetical protein